MRKKIAALLAAVPATSLAANLALTIEIPNVSVAEYHRPYVAMWIEKPDQTFAANLAVWYDTRPKTTDNGVTWLKDLRQWWRKSGRELTMPVDGVSGATRPPGIHSVVFASGKGIQPGSYLLVVEAVREVGGRELIRIPFEWPARSTVSAKGKTELGAITLTVKP